MSEPTETIMPDPVPISFYGEDHLAIEILVTHDRRAEIIAEFVAFETYASGRKHLAVGDHFVKTDNGWERRLFAIPYDDVAFIL